MARISYKEGASSFRRLLNHSPEVSEAYWGLREALNKGAVPPKLRMLSFLAADITNHCRYWTKAHSASGRALGITQEMVDAIPGHFEHSPLFTDEEKAVVAASIELSKKAELSNEAFDRIASHLDERQIVELVVNIGVANLNNRFTDALWADTETKE